MDQLFWDLTVKEEMNKALNRELTHCSWGRARRRRARHRGSRSSWEQETAARTLTDCDLGCLRPLSGCQRRRRTERLLVAGEVSRCCFHFAARKNDKNLILHSSATSQRYLHWRTVFGPKMFYRRRMQKTLLTIFHTVAWYSAYLSGSFCHWQEK